MQTQTHARERESVLSGPGIVNLYQAMSSVWGMEAAPTSAERLCSKACPQNRSAIDAGNLRGLLGGAAGNLALTVGARGGVYISGGIAPKLVDML